MIKKMSVLNNNIACSVEFLLEGAKKRRSMSLMNAKMVNSEMGVEKRRLIALT